MRQFVRNLTLSKKVLFASFIIFVFLMISGLFSQLNSSSPRLSTEGTRDKHFGVYQTGAMVIKNVANVQSNLDKVTRWANAGFNKREVDLLGKDQLAVLDGADELIEQALLAEWLAPAEKRLCKVILNHFRDYKESCISTMAVATSDLQMAMLFIGVADDHFKELNRSLHDLLDLETKLCLENSNHPNRSLSAALGNLYPAAGGCHRSVPTDQPMSRQSHYRSCL